MLQQGVAARPRGLSHTPHVALEVSSGDELGHHHLVADIGVAHVQRAAAGKRLAQTGRQHQVAEAQCGKSDLAEGADVKHPSLPSSAARGVNGVPL
ncbi:hypothetical protein D3C77_537500 [compost metagenome]